MIDNLILLTTHALLLITAWRLINRPELDDERPLPADAGAAPKRKWGQDRKQPRA